ncbi:MAG: hypothetical protein A3C11_00775 [Candidatus Sungbacteria bacterium RIFCSPHIGHO2_02_FULL_49_12]|uniref:Septum formation initiator n=1 Tax=Candidatus Sungbacteria bacterium RIFCSPHIGHO2_02_FULL_49_12 TaxID=1802271 RepID=A0A1G2KP67_9BACT|nr:MAG: hypothetical protein A3C11_00775 [Candidatus Sungbacteria bacterium RIFCSPHIGHO2_02_FULL_49_12]
MKKFLTSPIIVLLLLVLAGLSLVQLLKAWSVLQEAKRTEALLSLKVQKAKNEDQELENRIRISGTPEAIERDAKDRLNLKNPGEEVVVVIPSVAASSSVEEPKPTFWVRFTAWLSSIF